MWDVSHVWCEMWVMWDVSDVWWDVVWNVSGVSDVRCKMWVVWVMWDVIHEWCEMWVRCQWCGGMWWGWCVMWDVHGWCVMWNISDVVKGDVRCEWCGEMWCEMWVMWWDVTVSDVWCVKVLLASGPRTSALSDVVWCVMCDSSPRFRHENFFADWCGEMYNAVGFVASAVCECVMCNSSPRCRPKNFFADWCVEMWLMCDMW